MAGFLNKSGILSVEDLPYEDVDVPEWAGKVRICGLTAEAASAFASRLLEVGPDGQVRSIHTETAMVDLLAHTLVDEKFNRLFGDAEKVELGKKSAAVLSRLFEKALRLSGLGRNTVEDLAKNLTETPGAALPTG